MYTVKEVSEMLDMTGYTIRHYTDNGLVPSIKRDKNNNRLFDQESINWLIAAKYLRGCGMTVKAIKDYINLCLQGDSTINERYEIIIEQKKLLKIQLQEISRKYQFLEEKEKRYSNIINHRIQNDSN